MSRFADSIRRVYRIPALSYAVVSGDSVLEMHALGTNRIGSSRTITLADSYRIGSNTKAITSLIAAILVKQGKLTWNTEFFDLFPELIASSRREYRHLTLQQLLSFRTKLFPYTYTYAEPKVGSFTGSDSAQRYQFTAWFMRDAPVRKRDSICFSNLGYVAAGLMLEKASGKSYPTLVRELGEQIGVHFQFGQPNANDTSAIWGHDEHLHLEPPATNQKLNWLLAAGNITMTLPDYVRFLQYEFAGLQGKSQLLSGDEYRFLHYGLGQFAVGWFWDTDSLGRRYSYNIGNPGTFLSKVYVYDSANRAYVILTNAQTEASDEGSEVLLDALRKRYNR